MSTLQQTLERAYAALNAAAFAHPSSSDSIGTQCSEAAEEIRALLAQPAVAHERKVLEDVEPVAWRFRWSPQGDWHITSHEPRGGDGTNKEPLYSASTVAALKAERDAALARVAVLEKDAARYQKLLDLWNGRDMRELFGIEDFAALDAAPQPQQEQSK